LCEESSVGSIFLSHVEKDLPIMEQIARGLEAAGYPTWYFERDVLPGTSYLIQITRAIQQCDAMVLIISPHALDSDQVTKEVVGAFENNKAFYPVLVDLTPPELKERQPEWRHALGGTAMIMVGKEGLSSTIPEIISGLKSRDIHPGKGLSPASHPTQRKTPTAPLDTEGERKNVTVMFADISGFTAMSEKMDPEEVTDLMNECFRFMGDCVTQHGGTVDKYMGDCVMALFGAPKSLEDAPHRAIESALEMHARLLEFNEDKGLNPPLSFHIGINTGPVIAGMVGGVKKQDFTVMGDTVNLASRMEDAAEAGAILVTEDTYKLVKGYFVFEDAGPVALKGKEQPINAYKALGPRRVITRIDACKEKGLSPFVGRSLELDNLNSSFEKVKKGHGQIVGVVGEPGVGKSRLVSRFRESLPHEGFTIIEGGCVNFGDTIPYLPILDMLKGYFDIKEDEGEAAIKKKMSDKATALSSQLVHILAPLCEVLSLKVDDEKYAKIEGRQRRERVFEAIRLLLIAHSQKSPLIVIVEDLHWMDKTSEEFLTFLINSIATSKIMLILLYRPEFTPSWVGKTYYSQIRVDQLAGVTITDLVKGILGGEEIHPELVDFIANRTEGNPLFIEEMTSNLLENGSIRKEGNRYFLALKPSEIKIPATVQGIIAARLDRLEAAMKGLMQTASVIGREFAFRILQAVATFKEDLQASLLTLQDLEFIYEKSLFPELEYIFKHALTQEVAYNSLLIKKRKETHGRVGQAIELIYTDRLEEFYEMLAYHYSMSEDSRKAYQYLKLSADKAVRNYANWEALRFYNEALRLLDSRPEDEALKREKVELLFGFHVPLFKLGYPKDCLEILHRAEALAQELGDQRALAQFHRGLSLYHTFKGDLSTGVQYAEKCFSEAELVEEIDLVVQSADQVCFAYFMQGNMLGSADVSRRALDLFEIHELEKGLTTGGLNVYSLLYTWNGSGLGQLGRLEEAKAVLEKAIRNAHEFNDWFQIGMAMMNLCVVNLFEGNSTGMIAHSREHIRCNEKGEIAISLGLGWSLLGVGYFLQGEHETARDYAEKGLSMQKKSGMNHFASYCHWLLSLILLGMEDLALARKNCEESLRLSQEAQARHIEGISFIALGAITGKENLSRIEEAQGTIRQGISILEERKLIPSFSIGYIFLGELFADANRKGEAIENLEKALALYQEMGVTPESYWLKRIRENLAKLESRQ
jgi:class 3 adenylate cyclase/tetratricopeptide (TPR) repeat protein